MPGDRTAAVNPPRQARSRRTLERIVRASLEILEEEGTQGLTVQAVVTRARSSVGSFYARFKGKDDLLDYLEERVWHEAAERWDRALDAHDWKSMGLRAVAWGAAALLAEAGATRASYLKALNRRPGQGDDAFGAFEDHVLAGIRGLLLERSAEIVHPDPPVGVHLGLRAMLAVIKAPPPMADGQAVPPQRIQTEAVSMLLAYLGNERRSQEPGPGDMDFFNIWG